MATKTTTTETTNGKATPKAAKKVAAKGSKGKADKGNPKGKGKASAKGGKADKPKAARPKPEGLRGPQIAILGLLKKSPNGLSRADIQAKLVANGNGKANLSEMIGCDDGRPNRHTITLVERKAVRLDASDGTTRVIITAGGKSQLEKALKAQAE